MERRLTALLIALASIAACASRQAAIPTSATDPIVAAPGAPPDAGAMVSACGPTLGFTTTRGGRGGDIVRVTTLAPAGAGSLAEALARPGLRVIVFEVGGVIDLEGQSIDVREPFVSIAGQTAPSPGITLIRGGIKIRTNDVVVQHLRVRAGEAGRPKGSGGEVDGISTSDGARNVIVDHCSLSWATDENLSASGGRFVGATPDAWRAGTSHRITFSNNIVAEGLSQSGHRKGEHSKGTLVHDNVTDFSLASSLYVSNVEGNPYFKGGARGVVVNNLIVNPKEYAMKYTLVAEEWGGHPHQTGQMAVVENVLRYGPNTDPNVPLLFAAGVGKCEVYLKGNVATDRAGQAVPMVGGAAGEVFVFQEYPPLWPGGLRPLKASEITDFISENAGARPWDRDAVDARIISQALTGGGKIVDSELDAGGYPRAEPTRAAFDSRAWDMECLAPLR